jgi:hypothetical protein
MKYQPIANTRAPTTDVNVLDWNVILLNSSDLHQGIIIKARPTGHTKNRQLKSMKDTTPAASDEPIESNKVNTAPKN